MATAPIIAPEEKTAVERKIQKVKVYVPMPKPVRLKERIQNLLFEIFADHEDFLGWTPD